MSISIISIKETIVSKYLKLLIFIFLFSLSFWMVYSNNEYFLREIEQFTRVIYFIVIIVYLNYITTNYVKEVLNLIYKLLFFNSIFTSLLLGFSYLSGIGIETYGEYSYGVKSFFKAANDLTLSLILGLQVALFLFYKMKKYIYLFCSFIILFGLFALGTRAGIIGGGITILCYFIVLLFTKRKNINLKSKGIILGTITAGIIFIMPFVIQNISKYNYAIEKYEKLLIESPRAKLEFAGKTVIKSRDFMTNLIGEGTVPFCLKVEKEYGSNKEYDYGKWVEQDIFDMIGGYGFLLGSLILLFPIWFLGKSILLYKKHLSFETFFLMFSSLIFVSHSFLAGHALNSPQVAVFIAVLFFNILQYSKKQWVPIQN